MPRSFIKGSQVRDESITSADLADDAVITRTIKDKNVTCEKLADVCAARLLTNAAPIARTCLTADLPAGTDLTLPGSKDYGNLTTFLTRTKIYRNGQLQYLGLDTDPDEPDVTPGSSTTKIKFRETLRRGATITVEIL